MIDPDINFQRVVCMHLTTITKLTKPGISLASSSLSTTMHSGLIVYQECSFNQLNKFYLFAENWSD